MTPTQQLAHSIATHAGTDYDDLPAPAQTALTNWCDNYLRWRGTTPSAARPIPKSPPTPEFIAARSQLRAASVSKEHP